MPLLKLVRRVGWVGGQNCPCRVLVPDSVLFDSARYPDSVRAFRINADKGETELSGLTVLSGRVFQNCTDVPTPNGDLEIPNL